MQEERWRHPWHLLCLVKEETERVSGNGNDNWLHLHRSRGRDMVAWWKVTNPQDQEQNYLSQSIMKITLQAEDAHR